MKCWQQAKGLQSDLPARAQERITTGYAHLADDHFVEIAKNVGGMTAEAMKINTWQMRMFAFYLADRAASICVTLDIIAGNIR